MNKRWSGLVLVLVLGTSFAGEMGAPESNILVDWTGFYAGIIEGWVRGSYDVSTGTVADGHLNLQEASAINAAGRQTLRANGFITGVESGYNWQFNRFLFGIEADLDTLKLNKVSTIGGVPYPDIPNAQFVIHSYVHNNWMFNLRPRLAFVEGDWLFFATGGLALTQLNNNFVFTDTVTVLESGRIDSLKTGFSFGGGIEKKLNPNVSIKAEYIVQQFARTDADVPFNSLMPLFPDQTFNHSSDFKSHMLRLGLNYHFNEVPTATVANTNWEFEGGARLWFNAGSLGAPQPLFDTLTPPTFVSSRIIYKESAYAGETFARIDHASGIFLKGFLGAGGISSGNMYDEDFPALGAYSKTLQINNAGHMDYASVDFGYVLFHALGAKFGPFIGYNNFSQHINTYGCRQLAGDLPCTLNTIPGFLGLAQNNQIDSMRIGLSTEFPVAEQVRLAFDTAYLPWMTFQGQDDHNARALLLPYKSYHGDGLMLESIIDYAVAEAWHVGVGGRYWAWNMRDGDYTFNFLTSSERDTVPARLTNERYGVFVQSSYHWGDSTATIPSALLMDIPTCWTGVYIGGQLGGGWSDDRWSDPFPSTPGSVVGSTNIAGFGDKTHATGAAGGGLIGANWQTGHLVLGIAADMNAANLRGENTCFTGLGGANCQRIVNTLGTATGRVGLAWGNSLLYGKGGGAWNNASYEIFANTGIASRGVERIVRDKYGLMAGAGLEYALTDRFSTFFEYNYMNFSAIRTNFSTILEINKQDIGILQSLNLLKTGVNFKF